MHKQNEDVSLLPSQGFPYHEFYFMWFCNKTSLSNCLVGKEFLLPCVR